MGLRSGYHGGEGDAVLGGVSTRVAPRARQAPRRDRIRRRSVDVPVTRARVAALAPVSLRVVPRLVYIGIPYVIGISLRVVPRLLYIGILYVWWDLPPRRPTPCIGAR